MVAGYQRASPSTTLDKEYLFLINIIILKTLQYVNDFGLWNKCLNIHYILEIFTFIKFNFIIIMGVLYLMEEYKSKLKSLEMDYLVDAIRCLETREEVYRFLEDVCTITEIKAMEQRLKVATMLRNKKTYLDIASSTGVSTATISRVNKSLNYGENGYETIFKRINWKDYYKDE